MTYTECMKIAKTYTFYTTLILLITIILLVSVWFGKKTEEERHIAQEQVSVFERYHAVLALEKTLIKKIVFDYSIWDEMVDFAHNPDLAWSKDNLEPMIETFNVSYIYVYTTEKKLVYHFNPNTHPLYTPNLNALSTQTPQFKEFFEFHDGKCIQFFLAPIHGYLDAKREGKPLGFFVVGRILDEAFFKNMEKITLGQSLLVEAKNHQPNSAPFHVELHSLSNETVGYIEFNYRPLVILFIAKLQNSLALSGIILLSIAFLLFYLLTKNMLFRPIYLISMALKTRHLNYILALSKKNNELGEIAHLIYKHEKQKKLLEEYKEIIDENTIVSKTNKKGIITYVNDQFITISGYSKEELIGKPHNIVRHPDTPALFFKEMWDILKNGKPWKGIIKNRRKDGSSYYVKSIIMPLFTLDGEIESYMAIRHDVSDLFEKLELLQQESSLDLPGRKHLLESIENAKDPHLAILNICDFREINTLYGQSFGDLYLKQLANTIQKHLPENIHFFHLQGDEFALFSDTHMTEESFTQFCQNLLTNVHQEGIRINNKPYTLALRIGIANGLSYLYNRAEIAIKEARKEHKSLIIYDDREGFKERLQEDIQWNRTLREALTHNRFTIFMQEIVPLHVKTNTRKKYEILIRLIDETGRIISPFHFIDLAKRMHLYAQLTQFVLNESIRVALELDCDISINITKEDILNHETTMHLFNLLHQHPNLKERITLELVESESIEDSQDVRLFLQKAHANGCLLAIDDFGSGYSNFEYLMRLSVNFIKIDGSLIKNIDKDSNAYETVKTITNFAKNLNIQVVAEFVHSKEVLQKVQELNIDFAQGFYLHEPSPKNKLKHPHERY